MTVPIVGVDPGGAETGIVGRVRDEVVQQALVRREAFPDYYRGAVLDELELCYDAVWQANTRFTRPIVALESVHAPNPHVRMMNVSGILATSEVIGWVTERCAQRHWPLVMVPPGGHGSAPLRAYPRRLVGARERSGAGQLRHVRSAWDIAYAGSQLVVRDPSLVVCSPVVSDRMDDDLAPKAEPEPKVTPEDVSRMVRRVNLARNALTKALTETVRACAKSGYSAKDIVAGDGTEDGKISRQRVYQMLSDEESTRAE